MRRCWWLIPALSVVTGCPYLLPEEPGGDTSSYGDKVVLLVDDGLASTDQAAQLAAAQHSLLALDVEATTDPEVIEAAMDDFAGSLAEYRLLMDEIHGLNEDVQEGLALLPQYTDPSGVDTLNAVTDAILAKQAECRALFAQVPRLPSTPKEFEKLEAAQRCVRQLEAIAAEQAMDTAVSDVAGLAGGFGTGAAVIYFGGTVLSGGGLLAVTAGGVITSRVVGVIWNACKPGPPKRASSGGGSCAFSHAKGKTGGNLVLRATGTGTLQVFIEGCAPVVLGGITIANGQSVSVAVDCVPLDDELDPERVADASGNATAHIGSPPPTDCASVAAVTTTTVPANPGPDDAVTVTAATLPPARGCVLSYTLTGTDGYAQEGSPVTDASGVVVFVVPAAHVPGIVDTVTTTLRSSGVSSTISYTF